MRNQNRRDGFSHFIVGRPLFGVKGCYTMTAQGWTKVRMVIVPKAVVERSSDLLPRLDTDARLQALDAAARCSNYSSLFQQRIQTLHRCPYSLDLFATLVFRLANTARGAPT